MDHARCSPAMLSGTVLSAATNRNDESGKHPIPSNSNVGRYRIAPIIAARSSVSTSATAGYVFHDKDHQANFPQIFCIFYTDNPSFFISFFSLFRSSRLISLSECPSTAHLSVGRSVSGTTTSRSRRSAGPDHGERTHRNHGPESRDRAEQTSPVRLKLSKTATPTAPPPSAGPRMSGMTPADAVRAGTGCAPVSGIVPKVHRFHPGTGPHIPRRLRERFLSPPYTCDDGSVIGLPGSDDVDATVDDTPSVGDEDVVDG